MSSSPPPPVRDPGFEAALAAAPEDAGLRLVYSDFLEERGEYAYARAHRWLAREGRYPGVCAVPLSTGEGVVVTYLGGPEELAPAWATDPAALPEVVCGRLWDRVALADAGPADAAYRALAGGRLRSYTPGEYLRIYYPSPQVAVEELAETLRDLDA